MRKVHLGFKAFDLHELACHFVARHAGIYQANGIHVSLLDTTFIPDDQLPSLTFQTACGAALVNWLGSAAVKVIFVATDRPMFWMYTRSDLAGIADLKGRSIAAFPRIAPPATFLRIILKSAGIHPDDDVNIEPARDDIARIGLLQTNDVAAAVVSSAILPAQAARLNFEELFFFGDAIQIPTSGLAVNATMFEEEPELVGTMVRCFKESLKLIHEGDGVLSEALAAISILPSIDLDAACRLVRDCYTEDGRSTEACIAQAISMIKEELDIVEPLSTESLYDFSLMQ